MGLGRVMAFSAAQPLQAATVDAMPPLATVAAMSSLSTPSPSCMCLVMSLALLTACDLSRSPRCNVISFSLSLLQFVI
ncbi:hypothetical protein L195_g035754 [Trifolium pratense]|uniref:Uncharacterized protein n=1 Tax=Trifolium pratense TaxID=57577 RepID=A0A2K3LMK8_TRIPR|nr:hypothetical protein L195_g035754 [Trifolium pratense]